MSRSDRRAAGGRYRAYLLALLAAILAVNGVDGVALGLVLQNIKAALHLTDSELGFLTGIAFSLFYSIFGIPIGRWADRGNRIAIIAVTTGLWSVMVVLVGVARSFWQLLVIRVGVAVGEAGCMPPAYSLIADYFTREERPKAVANYLLGASVSVIIGYFVAGWLNHLYGWRIMFALLGVPGLVLAPLVLWTLKEPRASQGESMDASFSGAGSPSTLDVSKTLWRNVTFRRILMTLCISAFFGSGIAVWQPSFFIRSYGLNTEELGFWLAIAYGVCGFVGAYCGGHLASRYAAGKERLQLRVIAVLNAGFGVIWALVYLSRNSYVGFALMGIAVVGWALQSGPLYATTQTLIPERMRAISISIIYLFINLVGAGLGPLLVGSLSDALHPVLGSESLRYALLAMCPGYLWGGWLLWRAAETVDGDIAAALAVRDLEKDVS